MNEEMLEKVFEKFEALGMVFTPEFCLGCIETAKESMRRGEVTVEGFYRAKQILISKLECPSDLEN